MTTGILSILFSPSLRFALVVFLLCGALPLYVGHFFGGGFRGFLTVAFGLLTALWWYGEAPRRVLHDSNIPGPPAHWLWGNLDWFVEAGGYHKAYEKVCQEYGRVCHFQMGHWPQVIVQDPTVIQEIGLSKFDLFPDRKIIFAMRKSKGLLTNKGHAWRASRRTLNPAFNTLKLAAFAEGIARHCQALTRRLDRFLEGDKEQQPIEMLQLFGDLTMDVIGSTSFDAQFGLQDRPLISSGGEASTKEEKKNDNDVILECAQTVFRTSAGPMGTGGKLQMFVTVVLPCLGPLFKLLYPILKTPASQSLRESMQRLESIMTQILEGRSQFSTFNNTNANGASSVDANFIDLVRKARDPDSGHILDNEEVRDQLNLFVLAGYETTANTLAFTSLLLAQHPEVEQKMVQEIMELAPDPSQSLSFKELAEFTYLTNIIKESLRLYPPGGMLSREATEAVTLGGKDGQPYKIGKGTWIVIPVYSLHRDELYWKDPLQFDPDRFHNDPITKYAHIPFGIGPRNCIGQRFAMEEIKLALIALYRQHTFRLHSRTELPLELRPGVTLSAAKGIWLTVRRRGEEGENNGVAAATTETPPSL